jgi:peptidoglycan hydrolase-like protein with peptidoglycan-binding domain
VLALGVAPGTANAAYSPKLIVSGSNPALAGVGSTTLDVLLGGQTDDATARVVAYAPAGYSLRGGRAPGAEVGRVVRAAVETAGAYVEPGGKLVAGDPAAYAADPCAPGPHAAVWIVQLAGGGVDLSVPLFVDHVDDPAERALGAIRIQACVPAQPRLLQLTVQIDRAFRNPARRGNYLWRGLFTPLSAATGAADPATTVESRSILEGSYRFVARSVLLVGRATLAGRPVRGVSLALWAGETRWSLTASGSVRTDVRGRFRTQRKVRTTTFFRASADLPAEDLTAQACGSPAAPGGCLSATRSPIALESAPLRVVVARPPTLRLGSGGPAVRLLQENLIRLHYLPPGSAAGRYDERTWHAVVAFQGWQGLPRDGNAGPLVWKELERSREPRPWDGLSDGVEIDRTRQVLLLVRGGAVVRAIHVSTGAYSRTPSGRFSVYRKEMLSWSIPFEVWMPYASYFDGGFAMHEYSSVPAYPASHGCVRIPAVEAPLVYLFAGYGTPVWIR